MLRSLTPLFSSTKCICSQELPPSVLLYTPRSRVGAYGLPCAATYTRSGLSGCTRICEMCSTGIDSVSHVRCVREDTEVEGLLYVGTERGMYISLDSGSTWNGFQLNLPVVPITDIKVHHGDLVISTQGRAFWVLDDLTPLRNWPLPVDLAFAALPPRDANLWGGPRAKSSSDQGINPDYGLVSFFYVEDPDSVVSIRIADEGENIIREFSSDADNKNDKIDVSKGLNKHVWDLRREGFKSVPGLMVFGGTDGTRLGPGEYTIQFSSAGNQVVHKFSIDQDPRDPQSMQVHNEKQHLLTTLHESTQGVFDIVKNMRYVQDQIESFQESEIFVWQRLLQ